jgi:hypothetical protein
MKASNMCYCMAKYDNDPRNAHITFITFCPINYWNTKKCLPDFFFLDALDAFIIPGYQPYNYSEDAIWISLKSKDEIRKDLNSIGFTENKEMEEFLNDCYEGY